MNGTFGKVIRGASSRRFVLNFIQNKSDFDDSDAQLLSAMRAASGLRSGKVLNTYPEGERSVDGQLKEFKKGAAILASELKLPTVPVALDRTYRICPHKSSRLHLVKVKINFGEPIDAREVAPDENDNQIVYEKVTAAVTERIRQMLDNGTWHD